MDVISLYDLLDKSHNSGEWQSPPLMRTNNDGRTSVWLVGFSNNELFTAWGTLDAYKEGRLQIASHQVTLNSTGRTIEEQSLLEANNLWKVKQKVDGYSMTVVEKSIFEKEAMLASQYTVKCIKETDFPVYVQPKLDGIRCRSYILAEKVILKSRGSELIMFKKTIRSELIHLIKFLEDKVGTFFGKGKSPQMVLDGELFSSEVNFDEISGVSRRKNDYVIEDELINYYIFDIDFSFNVEFEKRKEFIEEGYIEFNIKNPGILTRIYLVLTKEVYSHDEIFSSQEACEQSGFEGVIIRRGRGEKSYYKYGRSTAMYKLKSFQDAEFTVVGAKDGKGKEEKCVIWILENEDGNTFSCRPAMSHKKRKEIYFDFINNQDKYIGRLYRVKYQDMTPNGIPRFGVGKGFVDDR